MIEPKLFTGNVCPFFPVHTLILSNVNHTRQRPVSMTAEHYDADQIWLSNEYRKLLLFKKQLSGLRSVTSISVAMMMIGALGTGRTDRQRRDKAAAIIEFGFDAHALRETKHGFEFEEERIRAHEQLRLLRYDNESLRKWRRPSRASTVRPLHQDCIFVARN